MKPGDLVKHKLSERGMRGLLLKHDLLYSRVLWDDGRCGMICTDYLKLDDDNDIQSCARD